MSSQPFPLKTCWPQGVSHAYLLHEGLDLRAGVVPTQSHVALVPLPEVNGVVVKGVLGWGGVPGMHATFQPTPSGLHALCTLSPPIPLLTSEHSKARMPLSPVFCWALEKSVTSWHSRSTAFSDPARTFSILMHTTFFSVLRLIAHRVESLSGRLHARAVPSPCCMGSLREGMPSACDDMLVGPACCSQSLPRTAPWRFEHDHEIDKCDYYGCSLAAQGPEHGTLVCAIHVSLPS